MRTKDQEDNKDKGQKYAMYYEIILITCFVHCTDKHRYDIFQMRHVW